MATILSTMLQRLYAGILRGPSIYARPGRQRIDWCDFKHFGGADAATAIATLLGPAGKMEFPAKVKDIDAPDKPESEWTTEQRQAREAFKRQSTLLQRLRDIAEDARDYQNDHGESALFVGFPLLWLPRPDFLKQGPAGREAKLLAPLAFIPVSLEVRRGGRPGAVVSCLGEGADKLIPNPALNAWIEQQTGQTIPEIGADEEGLEPWKELAEIIGAIGNALSLPFLKSAKFDGTSALSPIGEVKGLPSEPALISGAILGLFPMANLGLLRDTRWMMENEGKLSGPVRTFLKPEATVSSSEGIERLPEPVVVQQKVGPRNYHEEALVTHADPCQAAAVRHARNSDALVIHGPPGTGKSQTIANIIGDHVARGERVLFVCDKRTAIDVVKYRLDALGLGNLCGVVHDPARDRTALYRQLRDSLENLAESAPEPDRAKDLAALNARLMTLHGELSAAYRALNGASGEAEGFHELAGEWLELSAQAPIEETEPKNRISSVQVLEHKSTIEEVLRRAEKSCWNSSPWKDALGISVSDFLSNSPTEWEKTVKGMATVAEAADEFADENLIPLDPAISLMEQAKARRELADIVERVGLGGMPKFCAKLSNADANAVSRIAQEVQELVPTFQEIERASLSAELKSAVQDAVPSIVDLNGRIQAIETYLPIATSFKRFFAFGAKGAATKALAPLGLVLSAENLEKARSFYRGLRARILVSRFVQQCAECESPKPLIDDAALKSDWMKVNDALAVKQLSKTAALLGVSGYVKTTLADLTWAPNVAANLRMTADRAEGLLKVETAVDASRLFNAEFQSQVFAKWRSNTPCVNAVKTWVDSIQTLEESVRLSAALASLPQELAAHASWHAEQLHTERAGLAAIRRTACEQELRDRVRADSALQGIDTEKVEVALKSLSELLQEKQQLVRSQARRKWHVRQRERLLAGTGTRLNGAGASLRQRLVMRGERALKLRQMLATGAGTPDGDPLFDVCPVWMTSPSTVAQVFPREALFDVVIFDEASQCRLEEALPVLLRAKRVVVAGDPKQLPPTRFFETALMDSTEIDAETAEELFEQQQSEIEDLLGAALNLNVQEAFLDVHYRSRDEGLIGFSNENFYGTRLQPIPGHPKNKALNAPLKVHRVEGIYENRANQAEAEKAVTLVCELLDDVNPPSIGIACFNLPQRDCIIDLLDEKAEKEPGFAHKLATARSRRGRDSFEGLFVKNLENVQGDERDVMIICTTFAPDPKGKFRRNFGALSSSGGGRRLNVLVTRARHAIHIVTSIPRAEYAALPPSEPGKLPNGRFFLYSYLRYAEVLEEVYQRYQDKLESLQASETPECRVQQVASPSRVAESLGKLLCGAHSLGSVVYWGNDGFCVDAAIVHPNLPADVTIGVLTDFNRFAKTPDPIEWELFRSLVLKSQGWAIHRIWTPALLRDSNREFTSIQKAHQAELHRLNTEASAQVEPA